MALLILRHAVWRLLIAVPMLLAVTFGTFVLLYSVGDPAEAVAGDGATAAQIEQIREQYGFDRPLPIQYGDWLWSFVQGDFGESLQGRGTVAHMVSEQLPPTLLLVALAMGMAFLVALVVGAMVAVRPGSLLDRGMQGFTRLGIAVPNFLVGFALILVFAIWIPTFPAGGYQTTEQVGLLESINYLVLPAVALAVSLMCIQARTFRAALLEQFSSEYVRTARMKGASEWQLFSRHVARNASGPLAAVIGLEVGVVITGAVVVEVVFAVPGIGTLLVSSVRSQDFPVVQALVAMLGLVVLLANLAADLVALWLKPASRSMA